MKFVLDYARHFRELITIGTPIVIGQLGIIILSFADTMMIGHHSTYELGAASFVNTVVNLVIFFGTGYSYGMTPVVSGAYGQRNFALAGRTVRVSIQTNMLWAAILMVVMYVFYLNIHRLGQPEELLVYIRPYYLVLLFSLPFVMLFNVFKQFADGITDTQVSMWILLGGNALNVIGNYMLIYGKFGCPEMGLTGAGLSTLASRIIMVLVFAGLFFYGRRYKMYRAYFWEKGHRGLFRRLNSLGWPVALQITMESAAFTLSAIMIGWLGTFALAAHQIMITVSQLCFMVYYGMGAAVAIRVGYFRGRGDMLNLQRSAYAGFHLTMLLAFTGSLIIFFLRNRISGWFSDSEEVAIMLPTLIIPFLLYQFGDGLQVTFSNALRGLADVKPVTVIAFVSYFMISLPVSYYFGFVLNWGLPGVWMGFPFGLTSAGCLFFLRFRYKTRLTIPSEPAFADPALANE